MGLKSYRFSISWPRVLPEGRGAINQKGLDFYDRLVDNLLQAEIVPNATLYHWDLPQALQDKGGWPNRDSVEWFVDYARLMFDKLGDRVNMWATHNEPWVIAFIGHAWGDMAPGIADYSQAFQTAHHLLVSHGKVVQMFREGGYKGEIGIVLNLTHVIPASDSEADRAAAQRADESANTMFLDPLFKGRYPEMLFNWIGPHTPTIQNGDLALINQPIDFLGINYYMSHCTRYNHSGGLFKLTMDQISAPNWGKTAMGWDIYPPGLTAILLNLKENYGNPAMYITENGCALPDNTSNRHCKF